MPVPVNTPVNDMELLGRSYYFYSEIDKKGKVRQRAFFPYNREDKDRPGFFTNKISVSRLCMAQVNGMPDWMPNVECALKYKGNRDFKGYGVARASFFRANGLDVVPAASDQNPFHAHIVLVDYNEPFHEVKDILDNLSQSSRMLLDRCRRLCLKVDFEEDKLMTPNASCPCDFCLNYGSMIPDKFSN